MKNITIYSVFVLLFFVIKSSAQVGINTNSISDGVTFQLESSSKGVLFPRIALTSRTATSPLNTAIPTGTMVFNTATAGTFPNLITPGLYWWSAEEQQWTNIGTNLDNATVKYTNSENTTNYNTTTLQNLKLFGNLIINESSATYTVNTTNQTVTIGRAGLYSISSLLSFDRESGGNASRLSLTARVYVNGNPAGTEQVFSPGYTASTGSNRGLFSHSFTEYLELNKGDVVSIKIKKTDGTYSNNYGTSSTPFLQSGDSSIAILRIR